MLGDGRRSVLVVVVVGPRRRAGAGRPGDASVTALAARVRAIPTWQVTLGAALLALGFLIAAQLASEGPRIRYTSQERTPLVETALDLQAQQEGLKQQVLDLRQAIQDLEAAGQGGAARHAGPQPAARGRADRRRARRHDRAGPRDPADRLDACRPRPTAARRDYLVSGQDVLAVVEELWLAGAEGVAVNGERVTVATAIVDIGGSVLVNSAYVAPPYQVVSAIGPADMFDRLTRSPGFVDFIRARAETFGIGVGYVGLGHRRPAGLRGRGEPAPRAGRSPVSPAASPAPTPSLPSGGPVSAAGPDASRSASCCSCSGSSWWSSTSRRPRARASTPCPSRSWASSSPT